MISTPAYQIGLRLLYRAAAAIGGGASFNMPKKNLAGHRRVIGNFHASNAAAVGFPRVRQSADGVNWDLVYVIPQDATQPDFQYPFDLHILLPYVSVEYTHGGAAGTLSATAATLPL